MKTLLFTAVLSLFVFFQSTSPADTVLLKNGKRIKGLILDEYRDRIVLSTFGGEIEILKKDIRSAIYDEEAKTLITKARNHARRENYVKAYYTYKKVLELDPELEEAKEQLAYLRNFLETKIRRDIERDMEKKNKRSSGSEGKPATEAAREELGIVVVPGDKYAVIQEVGEDVVVSEGTHLLEGDRIISVWGEMAAYMDAEEVADMLLGAEECRMVIERSVDVDLEGGTGIFNDYKSVIGGSLKLTRKGAIVESVSSGGPLEEAGIKKGDLIYRIAGKNTRYMPMEEIFSVIKDKKGQTVEVVFRRTSTICNKEK